MKRIALLFVAISLSGMARHGLAIPVTDAITKSQELVKANQFEEAQKLLKSQKPQATDAEGVTLDDELITIHMYWAKSLAEKGDIENAILHLKIAYDIGKIGQPERAGLSAFNIGNLLQNNLNRSDEALRYYNLSLDLHRQIKDTNGEIRALYSIVLLYEKLGRQEEVIRYYNLILPLMQATKDQNNQAMILLNTGNAYVKLGRHEDALKSYSLSASVLNALKNPKNEGLLLAKCAKACDNLGRYEEAARYYNQALSNFKSLKDPANESNVLDSLTLLYFKWGHEKEALISLNQTLSIYRTFKDSPSESKLLMNVGSSYLNADKPAEALTFYQRALPVAQTIKDKNTEANTLKNMGVAYKSLARYDEALKSFKLALPIQKEIQDMAQMAITLELIADTSKGLGRYEEQIRTLDLVLPLYEAVNDQRSRAIALGYIGSAYLHLNRYDEALRIFNLTLPIVRTIKDSLSEAAVLVQIGSIYQELNRPTEALPYHNQALALYRAAKDRRGEAATLNTIGGPLTSTGNRKEAFNSYNQALSIAREIKNGEEEGAALANLGYLQSSQGNFDQGLLYYKQALVVMQARENPGQNQKANYTLVNMAALYNKQKRYVDAVRSFNIALPGLREAKDRRGEVECLLGLMAVFQIQKQPRLAIFYGKQAVSVTQSIRRDIVHLDAQSRASYLQGKKDIYQSLAALLIEAGRLPEAEQVARLLKAQETFDFVRRDADLSALPEALSLNAQERAYLTRYNELGEQSTTVGERIAAIETKSPSQRSAQDKAQLVQLRADQKALNGRWEVFRRELTLAFTPTKNGAAATLEKVDVAASDAWQKALQTLEAQGQGPAVLLSTVVAPERFYIVLTSAHGKQQFSFAIKDSELNTLVSQLRADLSDPRRDPRLNAKKLYEVVFCQGALESALQKLNTQVVLWSLSGSLRYIPFDALYDGQGYLLERARLNAVMTLTSKDYFEAPKGGEALAVGTSQEHTVQLADGAGVPQSLHFEALSQVPDEVRGIVKEATKGGTGPLGGELLLDKDFTAQSLETALQEGYRTVHVATHFRLQPGDDRTSFLLLGDGNPLPVFDWKVKMPLSGVELLTLSACETGVAGDATAGEATGAEVGSLGEIAQRLGAASVVASLWPVADSSTSLLMKDFYTTWQAHPDIGKGQALRLAQRALLTGTISPSATDTSARGMILNPLAEVTANPTQAFHPDPKRPFAHPYYWAPFFLTGNWR